MKLDDVIFKLYIYLRLHNYTISFKIAKFLLPGRAPLLMISDSINVELPWYISFSSLIHIFILILCRIEKYRPQLLKDIVGNEEIVSRLQVIGKTGNIPNLLLSVNRALY